MKTNTRNASKSTLITSVYVLALGFATLELGACSMAARPLPAATSHDPGLEAEAMRAFPSMKDMLGMKPSGTPIAARIVGGWNVAQNEYTGVATKRFIDIVVVVKDDDGTCNWTKGRFSQSHMGGGSYGELHAEFPLEKGAVDCKNLEGGGSDETSGKSADASTEAAFAAKSGPTEAPAPAQTNAEYEAKVEKIVEGLGADAVDECKTYVREACKRQKGTTRLTACRTYADSIKPTASSTQGAIICKAAADGLPK